MKCFGGAFLNTKSALYTLGTLRGLGRVHRHFADSFTLTARDTFILVTVKTDGRNLIESTVNGTERTKISAEGSVYYHRQHNEDNENCHFPGVKPTDSLSESLVEKHKSDTALSSADGTDVFAEPRVTYAYSVNDTHRKNNNKKSEDYIFKLSEYHIALEGSYLSDKGYLMQ